MAIFNCTPHTINVFLHDDVDFSNPRRLFLKSVSIKPTWIFESCGTILNAQIDRVDNGFLGSTGISLVKQVYTSVDSPLSVVDSTTEDWFIVSALYKAAALANNSAFKLLTVDSVIYSSPDNITPVGCLNLAL